jgi:hypothetical protein
MFAQALTNYTYDPLEALAQLRPRLLAAGMGPPPDAQGPPSG